MNSALSEKSSELAGSNYFALYIYVSINLKVLVYLLMMIAVYMVLMSVLLYVFSLSNK